MFYENKRAKDVFMLFLTKIFEINKVSHFRIQHVLDSSLIIALTVFLSSYCKVLYTLITKETLVDGYRRLQDEIGDF